MKECLLRESIQSLVLSDKLPLEVIFILLFILMS